VSGSDISVGFQTLDTELHEHALPVDGSIPSWLQGTLIRNGPGKFDVGGNRLRHWFDGLAMLRKYEFADGGIQYTNRFLRSKSYADALDGNANGQFATDRTGVKKVLEWAKRLGPPQATDNANVHVAKLDGELVAQTEVPRWSAFDDETLATRGAFGFQDLFDADMITAHLVADPHRNEHVGHAIEFGRTSSYNLFRIPDGTRRRERIASITTDKPAYVHSIGVSQDHIALVETPLRIALKRALSPFSEGFFELLDWEGDRQTNVSLVDRSTGEIVREHTLAAFFTFHTVNAFDDGDAVVLDLVAFEDASIVDAMRLDVLDEEGFQDPIPGRFERIRLPFDGSPTREQCYLGGIELPTVPTAVTTKPYRYAYGQSTDRQGANGLVKVDTKQQRAQEWWEDRLYVEEPIMVQHPDGNSEDEGVILATAIDIAAKQSVVLVFDAEQLELIARAPLPHVTPFGFHGRFFPAMDAD